MDELVSIQQAARILEVKQITVRRLIKNGRIPALRIGPRLWRMHKIDVYFLLKIRQRLDYINPDGNENLRKLATIAKDLKYPSSTPTI